MYSGESEAVAGAKRTNKHRHSGRQFTLESGERALAEGGFLWGIVDGGLRWIWVRGSHVGDCRRGSTLG